MDDKDNNTGPKRARRPTQCGVYAGELTVFSLTFSFSFPVVSANFVVDAATEKTRQTREGNQQKKELATEANSQTYSAKHGVCMMFDLADPTSSTS